MDDRAEGDESKGHGVSREDVDLGGGGDDLLADLEVQGRQDVAALAVPVPDKGDERRPVRVVLDGFDDARYVDLIPLEIDNPVKPLVTASPVADGEPSPDVTPARF